MPAYPPLTAAAREGLFTLLAVLPHGVFRTSTECAGVVETSSNLAIVETAAAAARVEVSLRSLLPEGLALIADRHIRLAKLAGAVCTLSTGYPGWQPDFASPLLDTARAVHRDCLGREAAVNVIHAGLECGVIGERIPGCGCSPWGPRSRANTPPPRSCISPPWTAPGPSSRHC